MFSLLTGVYESYLTPPQLNLLVVGAQGVGKTTFLERVKVTQFDKSTKATVAVHPAVLPNVFVEEDVTEMSQQDDVVVTVAAPQPSATAVTTSRFSWICPSPQRYQQAAEDSDDDEKGVNERDGKNTLPQVPSLPTRSGPPAQRSSTKDSMQSIELQEDTAKKSTNKRLDDDAEYDVKPKAKMLPLHLIRPTIGMNLAKVDICKAKIHVWDLGGRLQDLWERYYQDCDAVVFCWKLGDDDNGSEDSRYVPPTPELQEELLLKVRKSIPDDVPFMILGHLHEPMPQCLPDVMYSTSSLLPHYHNPLQALYFANARTGQGIKTAMEWLIPLAKKQLKVRWQAAQASLNKL